MDAIFHRPQLVDKLWMDKLFHSTFYNGRNYLSGQALKLIRVKKGAPACNYLHLHGIGMAVFTHAST